MGAPVIQMEAVGKRYRLGEHHGQGTDLREATARLAARLRGRPAPTRSEIWSLRDVSLEVREGDVIGIVGSNGAGKSTMLKVINGITAPTEGVSRTRGRIGSLLEVGTGFHGELTGRENTFLNGAILGMSRREVNARLDEIVEFAGLQTFMDTPVKRYSSGMYLRLGFAIAAHLEADILLVDEVLAVGDTEFQRRCLGKMSEIGESGRTVVFISHSMESVVRLCDTAVWLDKGRIMTHGPSTDVVDLYGRSSAGPEHAAVSLERDESLATQIVGLRIVDEAGASITTLTTWSGAHIELRVVVVEKMAGLDVGIKVKTPGGITVLEEYVSEGPPIDLSEPGTHVVRVALPPVLAPGDYSLGAWLGTAYEEIERLESLTSFRVEGSDNGCPDRLVRLGLPWSAVEHEPPLG